jgi:hypothetical protein
MVFIFWDSYIVKRIYFRTMGEVEKNIENMEVAVASQSTQAALTEQGWVKGRIFKRRNCDNYPQGYGVFTGKWGFSEDYTLIFTDGSEFLWSFCELVQVADPEVAWFINLELERINKEHSEFMEIIGTSYQKIYNKAINR